MLKHIFCLLSAALIMTACSTAEKPIKVHHINGLSDNVPNTGAFQGLEFLADVLPGQENSRVNVFYVHGIGWTENPDGDALANDFLAGLEAAYQVPRSERTISSVCADKNRDDIGKSTDYVFITAQNNTSFETAIPGSRLTLDRMVCIDKQVVSVDDLVEFAVYRVFWDDLFWNAIQFPHVGQDDYAGSSKAFAGMRRKYNRKFKDELVNYGFSDAVMYLGPAGVELRRALQGAMCSVALDAAGHSFAKQGHELSHTDACALAQYRELETNQFAFVTESLGSKITYDVMRESLSDGQDDIIDDIILGSEFYMLANQLALLSLNDLSKSGQNKVTPRPLSERPKIIALSEMNDFLTYETIPFLEQVWKRSQRRDIEAPDGTFSSLGSFDSPVVREKISELMGFDFVDIRLEFADPLIPLVDDLVDPLQAHGGHASEPDIMLHILCGAKAGKLNDQNCLATELRNTQNQN